MRCQQGIEFSKSMARCPQAQTVLHRSCGKSYSHVTALHGTRQGRVNLSHIWTACSKQQLEAMRSSKRSRMLATSTWRCWNSHNDQPLFFRLSDNAVSLDESGPLANAHYLTCDTEGIPVSGFCSRNCCDMQANWSWSAEAEKAAVCCSVQEDNVRKLQRLCLAAAVFATSPGDVGYLYL